MYFSVPTCWQLDELRMEAIHSINTTLMAEYEALKMGFQQEVRSQVVGFRVDMQGEEGPGDSLVTKVCVCVCVCVFVTLCAFVCACVCACMCVCTCMRACACVHACVCARACVCVCVYACVCACVHVCVCVYVCHVSCLCYLLGVLFACVCAPHQ